MPLCSLCPGRSFIDDDAVRMHRESKHPYACHKCSKVLKSQQALDQHDRDKHFLFECEYCIRKFTTDEGRLSHERAEHTPTKFECEYCDREFNSEQARQQHEDAKHSFECHYCDDEFSTEEGRQQHEDANHNSIECQYCNRQFKSEQARQQHEDAKHSFECHYCDYEFNSEQARQQHEDAKHSFECHYCDYEFNSEQARQQHEDAKHSFECHYCHHEFNSEQARQQHEDAKHQSTFECEYCDRKFNTEQARQQHEDSKHHFECHHCARVFGSVVARQQHEDASHRSSVVSQIWSTTPHYDCTYCKKEFPINALKVTHERSCTSKPATSTPGPPPSNQPKSTQIIAEKPSPSVTTQHTEGGSEPSVSPRSAQSTLEEGETFHSTSAPSPANASDEDCVNAGSLGPGMDEPITGGTEGVNERDKDDAEDHRSVVSYCAACIKVFQTELAFRDHVCVSRTPALQPHCPICYSPFDDAPLLEKHLEGLQSFSCQLCPTRCCSDEMLQDHLLSHPTCGKCGDSFADNLALCAHVESDHPVVVCWDCDGIVVENRSLELHYAESSAHPSCAFCGMGKRNSVDMAEHIRNDHATSGEMTGTDNVNRASPDGDTPLTETQPPQAEETQPLGKLESTILDDGVLPGGPGDEHHSSAVQTETPFQVDEVVENPSAIDGVGEHQSVSPSPTPSEHGSDASRPHLQVTNTATNEIRPPSPVSSGSAASLSEPSQSPTSSSSNSAVYVSADGMPEYVRENRAVLVATSAGSPSSDGTPLRLSYPSSFDFFELLGRTRVHDAAATGARTGSATHRLHCRICFRDPCADMTVTLCGHLFCKTCITQAVVARSACPVCQSAILLYCLFKLDLSV